MLSLWISLMISFFQLTIFLTVVVMSLTCVKFWKLMPNNTFRSA